MASSNVEVNTHFDDVMKKIENVRQEKLLKASEFTRNKMVEKLSGNRSGRTYRVPGTSVTYTASRPGEPPASRTGQSRGSIDYEIRKDESYIGSPLKHMLWLEVGTRNMAPRPWLNRTVSENWSNIRSILQSRWF